MFDPLPIEIGIMETFAMNAAPTCPGFNLRQMEISDATGASWPPHTKFGRLVRYVVEDVLTPPRSGGVR